MIIFVTKKGLYLPKFHASDSEDRVLTFEYLFGAFNGTNFTMKRDGMKIHLPIKRPADRLARVNHIKANSG